MSTSPIISFVCGVDRHGARPPRDLPHRFAVLTWFDNDHGMADPWSLFRAAIPRIAAITGAERIMAEYWRGQQSRSLFRKSEEHCVAEVAWLGLMHSSDEELSHQTFPSRIRFSTNGLTQLLAVTEPWYLVGGPTPYHDSVTVSFFSAIRIDDHIREVFTDEAEKLTIAIR